MLPEECAIAFSVLQTVVCTEEPVLISDIPQFLEHPNIATETVKNIILSLHAVLYISDDCAYSFHKSFVDFLVDATRSKLPGLSLTSDRHYHLAAACFSLMDSLCFNHYGLISSALRYACHHWAAHMTKLQTVDPKMKGKMKTVYWRWLEDRSLFWMEAMLLLRMDKQCYPSLQRAREWLETNDPEETKELLGMESLASQGRKVSTIPRLYTSALPRAMLTQSSSILTRWLDRFPGAKVNAVPPPLALQHAQVDMLGSFCSSPDGTLIAAGSDEMTIHIWETSTGNELHRLFGHGDWVQAVCFSQDGTRIVSGSDDKTLRIWNASTGNQLRCFEGHDDYVRSVHFSSDGVRIVSGSRDKTVRIWDVLTGRQLHRLEGHTSYVQSVCFLPDGICIASGSLDKTVRIWDASTGNQLRCLNGHADIVQSVCFSPDGTQIVSWSPDKTVCVWDVSTGNRFHFPYAHYDWVRSICFSPDMTCIVFGSDVETRRFCVVPTRVKAISKLLVT